MNHNRTAGLWPDAGRAAAALLCCAAITACSTAPSADLALTRVPVINSTAADPQQGSTLAPYLLGAGDEFDIRFADTPVFDQTAKVRPDGSVNFSVIGSMRVAGKSPEEVQTEVRERYRALAGSDTQREYLIHANDELEIKLPYYPQLNDLVRVRPDGKIQMQLAGTVQAEGLSPEELQLELQRRYARFLREPVLTVMVRAAVSQAIRTAGGPGRGGLANVDPVIVLRSFQTPQVFVTGEVSHAGPLPYVPGLTLLQALASAGGNLPSGDVTKLVVLRRTAADSSDVLRPHLTKTFRAAPTRDFILQPFDVVILPPTRAQTLAESLDRYVYKIFAPLKNSTFGYVFGATKVY